MKIEITHCNDPSMWYYDRIGEVFKVERKDPDQYWCREGGPWNCINIVKTADAIIVEV